MSYTKETTSSRSLRVKARERFGHAGDRRHAGPGLNEPPNGMTPPDPTFGLARMLERVGSVGSYALVPVDEGVLTGRNPSAAGIAVFLDGMSP